ncbi:HAMP domain-containing histidine kinase [Streptomyces sp. NBC_01304]|nr:HAMP domain-containing histidine kinase [Streptomyces sp. NBC_01304]
MLLRKAGGRRRHGIHSLRAKLTLTSVAVLALGIVVATAVSLMGMRHYLLDSVDSELLGSAKSLERTGLTRSQIEAFAAIGSLRDELTPGSSGTGGLPRPNTVFVALDERGEPLSFAGTEPTGRQRAFAAAVDDPAAIAGSDEAHDVSVDGDSYRAVGARLGDGTTVLMATSTEAVHAGVQKALKLDLAVGSALLGLLAWLTLMGAGHRLRPLEDMVETASAIAEGDLTRRVPPGRDPVLEIEQLRVALNSMLHQVESAFDTRERSSAQLRRFVADASHELRTPLAAIRGYLQLYDKGMLRDPADRKRAWTRMHAETDRMGRLVDELLTLARLDQQPELQLRHVDLSRLVRDAAADLRAQEPERPLAVSADGSVLVRADEAGLRQVLANLLANIRTHTPVDAAVTIDLTRSPCEVHLSVTDRGPGLAPEDASRIFDRFFRAGGGAGSGLGMAIVQGVVAAHGGRVEVRTGVGEGLAVMVRLPVG